MPDLAADRTASETIGEIITRAGWTERAQLHLAERFIHRAGLLPAYAEYLEEEIDADERADQLPEIRECCGHANAYDSCNCWAGDNCPCIDA